MAPLAHVVHRTRGRLRLRIPEHRYDAPYFTALTRRLAGLPGVRAVTANPETAGVLLRLEPDPEMDPVAIIRATGQLQIVDAPPPLSPTLTGVRRTADRLDQALEGLTGGLGDLRTLAFALLIILAVRQTARGQLMAPAASLLWYAFELVRFARPAPDA
jgi:hypothetical protein